MIKTRAFHLNEQSENNGVFDISVSSETPVLSRDDETNEYFFEVLGHDENEVDLSFFASGNAPFLFEHKKDRQIGVIDSAYLEDKKLRAKIRFSKAEKNLEDDVKDNIRKNISIGYFVAKYVDTGQRLNNVPVRRAVSWKLHEASLVSIPADPNVGVMRSLDENTVEAIQQNNNEETQTQTKKENKMEINIEQIRAESAQAERTRVQKISELGAKYNLRDAAKDFIENNKSVELFNEYVLENMDTRATSQASQPIVHATATLGLSNKEAQKFSIARAIQYLANPKDKRFEQKAAFEIECSRALEQASGLTAQGILIPFEIQRESFRDLTVAGTSQYTNSSTMNPATFIDALRASSIILANGATVLANLKGNLPIPRMTTDPTATHDTEGAAFTESTPVFDQLTLSPKIVNATVDVSKLAIHQSELALEALITDTLRKVITNKMDQSMIYGNLANGGQTGLFEGTEAANFNAAVPSWEEIVGLESSVTQANNINYGSTVYISNATLRGKLKTKSKDAGSGQFIHVNGEVNGYKHIVSTQITQNSRVIFGDLSNMLVGLWGGIDVVVDQYTLSRNGLVSINAFAFYDHVIKQTVNFYWARQAAD